MQACTDEPARRGAGSPAGAPALAALALALAVPLAAWPQAAPTPPDAGAMLRDAQRTLADPERITPAAPRRAPAPAAVPRRDAGVRFTVQRFDVQGRSLLPEADVQQVLAPWLKRSIGFQDLEEAAIAVTALYAARGWLVRAEWPPQELVDGSLRLRIVEARLGQVQLQQAPGRLGPALPAGVYAQRLQPGQPLRLDDVERATRLLNDTPGVRASVLMAEGREPGQTDLVVSTENTPLVTAWAQLDNAGARTTGSTRALAQLGLQNPAGNGDQASLDAIGSRDSGYARLAYSLPVGYDGVRLGAQAGALRYRIGQSFSALGLRGGATTLALSGNWRAVRSLAGNVTLGATLEQAHLDSEAGGSTLSERRNRALRLSLSGERFDFGIADSVAGAWLQLSLGSLALDGPADARAADAAGPRTAGRFGKLQGGASWFVPLNHGTSLGVNLQGQLASGNLDSSESFALGGANGVRAYAPLEASGDDALLMSLDLRQRLLAGLQASVFCDAGWVRVRSDSAYAGSQRPNAYGLRGCGGGAQFSTPGGFALQASAARRIGNNPAARPDTGLDADGSGADLRYWLSMSLNF